MIVAKTISDVRQFIQQLRECQGPHATVGFVPTMGALHAGHLSLVEAAGNQCDLVVLSIFVNPTQFGPREDFEKYPRPLQKDLDYGQSAGVDCVFTPSVEEIYPAHSTIHIHTGELAGRLCGKSRPGHFDGVALVVSKFFNIVQPDRAYFGQKDFQQATIIKRMVRDLNFPIEIVVCPTVREQDGLAMSSRNIYLNPSQRQQATVLYQTLKSIQDGLLAGEKNISRILDRARKNIEQAGPCVIDYIELVHPETLQPVASPQRIMVAVLAVRIGDCRLIDNLIIDIPPISR